MVDVFHTVFGVAGLSILGYPGLKKVNPILCVCYYGNREQANNSQLHARGSGSEAAVLSEMTSCHLITLLILQ